MSSTELDIWLSLLGDVTTSERGYAESFMRLEDSMFFLASIGDETVGGTAIFRDRTRLAMALVSVQHPDDFDEIAKQQLLKSSLPFFRSVSIHHVDVISSTSEQHLKLPFPMNFEIGAQLKSALLGLGFIEQQTVYHYSIDVSESHAENSSRPLWKESHDYNAVRDLFWKQNKTTGLDSSLITLGWEMAMTRGKLVTYDDKGSISIALGIEEVGDATILWPLIADLSSVDPNVTANAIYEMIQPFGTMNLQIPIVASGQQDLVTMLGELCAGDVSFKENTLMRKNL